MIAPIIVGVIVIIITALLVRLLLRTGIMCQFCQAKGVKVWRKLTPEQQSAIREYFLSYENRDPETGAIFVCDNCKTVFDDLGRGPAATSITSPRATAR